MAIATSSSSRGGYDYSFVHTPPDELVCKICHCPSREPHLSVCCGHTFCKSCLEDAKQASMVTKACPMCREENFTTFPNKQNERAVKNLHVFCTNKGRGCEWQGEVNNISGHLSSSDGCRFERINCSNKCGLSLERRYLSNHVDTKCPRSKVTCQYCSITGERQFITGVHLKEQCPKVPLLCPNKCDIGKVLRETMEAHKAECPLEMIQCEYHEVGCKDSMARKDKMKHDKEQMQNHLSLMKSEYLHTTNKLTDAEKKIRELESATTSKLADVEKKVRDLELESVTTSKLAIAEAEKRIRELESANSILQQKTQLVEEMMYKHIFQWHTTLAEKVKLQHSKIPITLRMSEYSKKKEEYSEWCSTCFSWDLPVLQEHPKIKLQIAPAGCDDGKGTHLSMQLYLVKGGRKRDYAHELNLLDEEYKKDCDRPMPMHGILTAYHGQTYNNYFQQLKRKRHEERRKALENQRLQEDQKWNVTCKTHRLYVTILNQISDSEHYSVHANQIDLETDHFLKNEDCRVLIFNSPHFISNEILHTSTATSRYLKDDIIYFSIDRVVVTPA